jgi:hypothetical protein
MTAYTHLLDLAQKAKPPANGILRRIIYICRSVNIIPRLPRLN